MKKTLILHQNEYKKWNEKIDTSKLEISKKENIIVPMTSNTSSIGKASAKSIFGTSYDAFKVFDGKNGSDTLRWLSSSSLPQWIQFEFNEPKIINRYSLTSDTIFNKSPRDFTLEVSNDGVLFNVLDSQTYQDLTSKKTYDFKNVDSYKFYRLNITANQTGVTSNYAISLDEWEMFEAIIHDVGDNIEGWKTISSALPTQEQFLSDGIDSLSPLLDRKVETLEPLPMTDKSEILLNNEVGQVFSETLNLKAYIDVRKMTPSSTNGKMIFKNTADNKYYIESSGSMIEITDTSLANILSVGNSTIAVPIDFYDVFGEEVEVLFYTSDTTLADLELTLEANWSPIDELDGNFEVVTWTDETDSTRTLEMRAIPKPQFIAKSTVSNIGDSLNGIIANTTSSNVRFLLTNDNSTWYKWNGTDFVNVNYVKVDDILTLGNTYDELVNADYSKWTHSKINIGVFLKDDDNTTSKVNELGIITNSPIRTSQVSDLNFYILNTTAKIELDLKGLWLSGQLSDLDLTRVQYRVFLNEQPYHPLSGQFTNLDNPPLNIDITFKSEEVKINDWNTLRVEFKDSFGTVDYWQTTFVGNYSSLMFADTDGNYYSDDVGKVLQYLDFGVFFGGQYSVEHEVVVKNQYGYDVNNLTIEASTGNLPEGVAVQFSDTSDPFTPQPSLFLPNELKNDEEVSFYIRMISDIDSVPNGENKFNIFVKAERKV